MWMLSGSSVGYISTKEGIVIEFCVSLVCYGVNWSHVRDSPHHICLDHSMVSGQVQWPNISTELT